MAMMMNMASEVGEDRAGDDLAAFGVQVFGADAALDDGGLDVELHERRDRGADSRDEEEQVGGVRLDVGSDDSRPDRAQCGWARIAAIG